MNKVVLMGNLARDPEVRYTQGPEPMCIAKFSLGVSRRFKKEGEPDADFIFCTTFRKTAEFAERYLKKGMKVAVCGSIRVSEYTDNKGERRWSTEVVCDEIDFAESRAAFESRMQRGDGNDFGSPASPPPAMPPQSTPTDFKPIADSIDEDDDLPF